MTRRRRNRGGDSMTLFPFLAVLICTMGSLIVLLVVVVQQARANAESVARAQQVEREKNEGQLKELNLKKDEFTWRIEVLESSQSQTAEELENRKRQLGYLEQEIREVSKQLDEAVEEAKQIAAEESDQVDKQAATEEEIEELRNRLELAEKDLELTRDALAKRKPSYAIVTYDGPHGTRRRPVFIECKADRIILQPEGVELYSDDFARPITDNNPLAAALRAKREYLSRAFQDQDHEPYPLLVVRPDGAQSYAAARMAMKSWDSEFGYELIDDEMEISFPKSDPALVQVIQSAIEDARYHRQHLQAIAPARFGRRDGSGDGSGGGRGGGTVIASRNGGFVRSDPSGQPTRSRNNGFGNGGNRNRGSQQATSNRQGIGTQPGFGGTASASSPTTPAGSNLAQGNGQFGIGRGGFPGNQPGGQQFATSGPGEFRAGMGPGNGGGTGNGRGTGSGTGPGNSASPAESDRSPYEPGPDDLLTEQASDPFGNPLTNGPYQGNAAAGAESAPTEQGMMTSGDPNGARGQAFTGRRAGNSDTPGKSSAGTASQGRASQSGSSSSSSNQSGASMGSSGQSQSMPNVMPQGMSSMSSMSSMSQMQPMADSRGRDWGLPSSGRGRVGITRPISVVLTANHLDLLPEDRNQSRQRIEFNQSLQNSMEDLVTRLWSRMDEWGIAGPGMHWKPVLNVRVDPSGEQRYQELVRLLEDSGIVVKRKN